MLVIASMGACASTMILDWFSKRTNCNCSRNSEGLIAPGPGGNHQGLKHRIAPPRGGDIPRHASLTEESVHAHRRITRAIFLFDDPRAIVLSLFDRGIAAGHAQAITGKMPEHQNELDRFLAAGTDSFQFSAQFENWANPEIQRPYFRMLVRGSEFWNYLPVILPFTGLPEEMCAEFPGRRERADRFGSLDENDRNRLNEIYSPLVSRIESFPNCVVV